MITGDTNWFDAGVMFDYIDYPEEVNCPLTCSLTWSESVDVSILTGAKYYNTNNNQYIEWSGSQL